MYVLQDETSEPSPFLSKAAAWQSACFTNFREFQLTICKGMLLTGTEVC